MRIYVNRLELDALAYPAGFVKMKSTLHPESVVFGMVIVKILFPIIL